MYEIWQRRRDLEDVPTPVAVALADFCRRAKAPAPPAEVRAALSLLREDEDFRVRALADQEPEAAPLGPFAVVDMLRGVTASLAATRQSSGYYDLAQQLVAARAQAAPPAEPPRAAPEPLLPAEAPTTAAPPAAPAAEPASETTRGRKASKKEAMALRIAPTRRAAGSPPPVPEPFEAPAEDSGGRRRERPEPKGRFSQLTPGKLGRQVLDEPEGLAELEAALTATGHRFGVLASLKDRYVSTGGRPLAVGDVEEALRAHGLWQRLLHSEREQVLSHLSEFRGALGRVSWALKVSPSELEQLIEAAGIREPVEQARERFSREALAPSHLTQRLDLLGRTRYLDDLGIRARFIETLERDLRTLLRDSMPGAADLPDLVERAARRHAVPAELLSRSLDRLGLSQEIERLLTVQNLPSP